MPGTVILVACVVNICVRRLPTGPTGGGGRAHVCYVGVTACNLTLCLVCVWLLGLGFGWVRGKGGGHIHAWREHSAQALPLAHDGTTVARSGLLSTCEAVCQNSSDSPLVACRGGLRT